MHSMTGVRGLLGKTKRAGEGAPSPTTPGAGSPFPRLWLFALVNYVLLVVMSRSLVGAAALAELPAALFVLAVHLTYPTFYLLLALGPVALMALGVERLPGLAPRVRRLGRTLTDGLAVAAVSVVAIGLYADLRTYEIFGFHLNGFVLNLLLTRGGVASMGAGPETLYTAGFLCSGCVAAEALLFWGLGRAALVGALVRPLVSRRAVLVAAISFLGCSSYERITFGWSDLTGYRPVLRYAENYPLYLHLRFKGFAKSLGFQPVRRASVDLGLEDSALEYPLEPLEKLPAEPAYNIVWLCAESLRADALDAEIMPATWQLAQRSTRFLHHMSGGNGTRMGVFSMFYGLPARYWFSFLNEQRGPVLIDQLLERGYQMEMFTSDDFSYPEFAKTAFARIPGNRLHEWGGQGKSWERDRKNIGVLLQTIDGRDPKRPFFVFSFLESPHARYDFPPESVIRTPYLKSFNYITADLERDIGLIKNRYVNSVHHLDSQIERVLSFLEERDLMDSTIVIVTGDHGEEFMEQGRWGHNSSFSEEQILVPLVLWIPGRDGEVVDRLTSHLDLPITLFHLLGMDSDPATYSTGLDLLGTRRHPYLTLSDWTSVVYLDREVKIRFPARSFGGVTARAWSRSDEPIEDERSLLDARAASLADMLRDLGRFRKGAGG